MNNLTVEIVVGVIVVLALFGFFLRRVSKEQGSVENLTREFDSMKLEQHLKETAALKELKKSSGQKCGIDHGRTSSSITAGT